MSAALLLVVTVGVAQGVHMDTAVSSHVEKEALSTPRAAYPIIGGVVGAAAGGLAGYNWPFGNTTDKITHTAYGTLYGGGIGALAGYIAMPEKTTVDTGDAVDTNDAVDTDDAVDTEDAVDTQDTTETDEAEVSHTSHFSDFADPKKPWYMTIRSNWRGTDCEVWTFNKELVRPPWDHAVEIRTYNQPVEELVSKGVSKGFAIWCFKDQLKPMEIGSCWSGPMKGISMEMKYYDENRGEAIVFMQGANLNGPALATLTRSRSAGSMARIYRYARQLGIHRDDIHKGNCTGL